MLNVLEPQICFQEVPNEIALGFVCTGCQLGCKGCHSPQSWNANLGMPLTQTVFASWLRRYEGLISCVVFFGGEWQEQQLLLLLRYAQSQGLKTCLYTGLDCIPEQLKNELTYLKTGRFIQSLGGLGQHSTNQKFIDVASGQLLNSYFIKG